MAPAIEETEEIEILAKINFRLRGREGLHSRQERVLVHQ